MPGTKVLGRHVPAQPSYNLSEGWRPVTMRNVKTFRLAASALVLLALAGCSGGVKASALQPPVDMG